MAPNIASYEHYHHGIRENLHQFSHQLGQVFLVGLTIGMMRTVVPALAELEFGVAEGSFLMLTSFVVAFGMVKGVLNFVAGRLAERIGRKKVLLYGWLSAIPIPVMVLLAPSWGWIVAATVLLGVNQGLCWSMTKTSKMDIIRADERGLTMGLNEFSGNPASAVMCGLPPIRMTHTTLKASPSAFDLNVRFATRPICTHRWSRPLEFCETV